ncbi:NAD+ synthase [Sulfuricystis multivorans]|uniref:NAD+ synthase n=1 Tax=Sulfuricystis multivorans TaxID=2211108 RepID=UPI000F8226A7|nr:NAD+ synthase [Sulfuricystis multivorans]
MSLKIAVAQIDCTVGDLAGNAARILAAADEAHAQGADLLLTPELALAGYPPEDLLLRPDFHRACARELSALAARLPLPAVVGHPEMRGGLRFNAASLLREGRVELTYHKQRLPNSEVFDEERYFAAGTAPCVFSLGEANIGLAICEDIWLPGTVEATRAAGAELLLALNASPFHMNKAATRQAVLRSRIAGTGIPAIYCNLVGGQDELVFDGASFALDAQGRLTHQLPAFEEALAIVEYADGHLLPGLLAPPSSLEASVYSALCLGVRDYLGKNGFPGAIIGLSGGIDSALTLAIAVDALGADKVRAVMMPSPYTAQMSLTDAREMAHRLGVQYDEIPIATAMEQFSTLLAPVFAPLGAKPAWDTTEENIQARIRGLLLMAISNRTGCILLTTGNKSEMAVGYATLYGDMAGGFAVLKDVFKTFVYRLAHYRNARSEVIPHNIITRAPSAELKANQTDQDSLPPYEILDAIIEAYMERDLSPREIIAQGIPEADVRRVIMLLKKNEYKRRQAPPGVRVTRRAFGKDWRYPITSHYPDEWS